MIRYDGDKNNLNIEHGFISIGGCENHDKGNNTMASVLVWVFGSTGGLVE